MLTIQLYGLAEHPKTQLLKISLLDALVELPVAFSFVQISTLDAFLEQKLPEIPCLMVNGGIVPAEVTQSKEALRKLLQSLDVPLAPPSGLLTTEELPPHAGAPFARPLPAKDQGPLRARRRISPDPPRPPIPPPQEDPDAGSPTAAEFPRRTG